MDGDLLYSASSRYTIWKRAIYKKNHPQAGSYGDKKPWQKTENLRFLWNFLVMHLLMATKNCDTFFNFFVDSSIRRPADKKVRILCQGSWATKTYLSGFVALGSSRSSGSSSDEVSSAAHYWEDKKNTANPVRAVEEVKSMGDDVEDKTEEEMLTILEACERQFHQYGRQQLATLYMARSLLSREREKSESNEK